jgi:hypothetical protein
VGLTEELAFGAHGRVLCPHCFDGDGGNATAGATWVDVGMPIE